MPFNKLVFEMQPKESYVKMQMDGFNDPTLCNFSLLSLTPIMRKEYKQSQAKEEYVLSYIEAAKVLAASCTNDPNSPIKMVARQFSIAIPCIFLCRQAIELSIKHCMEKCGDTPTFTHPINELWSQLKQLIAKNIATLETHKAVLEKMDSFISIICSLDNENSTQLRYPVRKGGDVSQKQIVFVALIPIVQTTELFIKQLNEFR